MSYAKRNFGCRANLFAGMTDGKYKKYAMDRGGVVEPTTAKLRFEQCGIWHGYADSMDKVLMDASPWSDPYHVQIGPMHKEAGQGC
jgi:hypothetical protein